MLTTIDKAGRVVIPKALREAIRVVEGGLVELELIDGEVVMRTPPVSKSIEMRDGLPLIVAAQPLPPLDGDTIRETLEAVRH